ncbi:hypothetical protein [Nostoc sp. CALU 1950]|uniref:hypothetical protein n=1 Tax=Nostoc sp. CALU 1950 TaxID=3104321 RepID=UPI003EBAFA94
MLPQSLRNSLTSLNESIADTQSVIQTLKRAINETRDPIDLRRYQSDIERLKAYIVEYSQEYQDLYEKIVTVGQSSAMGIQEIPTKIETLHTELQQLQVTVDQVNAKVDRVVGGQAILYQSLSKMRRELLLSYDAREQHIIQVVVETFNQNQMQLAYTMLSTLDQLSQSQMEQILSVVETQVLPTLPPATSEVAEIVKDASLDIKHRLKIAIPLIPFVELESEIEFGTGMDLLTALEKPKELWKQVIASLRWRK